MLNAIRKTPPQPKERQTDNNPPRRDTFENVQPLEDMGENQQTSEIVRKFTEMGQDPPMEGVQQPSMTIQLPEKPSHNTGLLCSYNPNSDRFTFYNVNNQELGFFTIEQTIKYIGNIYDNDGKFLTHLDERILKDSKQFIKQFVFRIKYNKDDQVTTFDFHDHTTSGFMGDIELLIKLNSSLDKYKREKLSSELSNLSPKSREQIERHVNQFIFLMLNYTLKLINIASDSIPDDRPNLSNKLMQYSIGIMHRISTFVQSQLRYIQENTQEMSKAQEHSLKIKTELKQKVEQLLNHVQKQSTYFEQLNPTMVLPSVSFSHPHSHGDTT